MIRIEDTDGSIFFGDFFIRQNMEIQSVTRGILKKEIEIRSPYASYRLARDLNENGIIYGLRLVLFNGKLKQAVIFCILGNTWDDWNNEMPEKERRILTEILDKNNVQDDYEYNWGRCYVFEDKKNLSCNLYIDYK